MVEAKSGSRAGAGRLLLFCLCAVLLGGCASRAQEQTPAGQPAETGAAPAQSAGKGPDASSADGDAGNAVPDDAIYIGEYLDADIGEPNLEIARGDGGRYIVQIGIYRLTSLSDGVGELTGDGMKFTATDASGNPIGGIITVEAQTAAVTFTDSTWEYLPNGSSFQYTKSSDSPKLWSGQA